MSEVEPLDARAAAQLVGCSQATIYRAWVDGTLELSQRRPKASTPGQVIAWNERRRVPALPDAPPASDEIHRFEPDSSENENAHLFAGATSHARIAALEVELADARREIRRLRRATSTHRAALADALRRLALQRDQALVADRTIGRYLTDQAEDDAEAQPLDTWSSPPPPS